MGAPDPPAALPLGSLAADGGEGETPSDPVLAGLQPTPTPSLPPEPPAAFDGTYVLGMFLVPGEGPFQIRMGSEPYWGYSAGARIDAIAGREIVMGPIQVGETISFDACRSRRTTEPHHMTIEKLGINYTLDLALSAEPEDDLTGIRDDSNNNCEFTFDAPGEYLIDDDLHPGAHGVAKVIVEG